MSIKKQEITKEIKDSYLDYAMSVIVSRALPDVRDGLKPVQRRILYAMLEDGLTHGAKFRKSATVVGSVLGRYHPHGDQSVYDATIRMAQDFSLRYPLIQGQGNIGSIDDPGEFAAMRYTEARLSKIGEEMLHDIEKETVDFVPNYDGTRKEPSLLPSLLPQLLLNGSVGIAVGMATNIPPHNLSEVCDGLIYLLKNEDTTVEDLFDFIKGPDFPTGGQIFDKESIIKAYETGRGAILNRGKAEIVETKKDTFQIIISEIPYGVQKSSMLEGMANLVKDKKIDGIRNLRDESDKEGMRVVVELKKESQPKKVLNQLFKMSQLESTFYLNMVALKDGIQPLTMSLKDIMGEFLSHRKKIVRRRTEFDLKKTKERIHILLGLKKALLHIDEIIETIKNSKSREEARNNLIAKFKFSERQSEAILETKLQALTRLEKEKILKELEEKKKLAAELQDILGKSRGVEKVIEREIIYLKEKYGDKRKTEVFTQRVEEFKEEDLIPERESILILTTGGYIKRVIPDYFHSQKRGGKGVLGLSLREEDKVEHFLYLSSHDEVLFFTSHGKVFKLPAYEIPEAERQSFGKGILNYLELSSGENITSLVNFHRSGQLLKPDKEEGKYLVMVTKNGIIKKTEIKDFEIARRSGLKAINLEEKDELRFVRKSGGNDEVLLASSNGDIIKFKEKEIRAMGRNASGVKGMKLSAGSRIVGMEIFSSRQPPAASSKLYLLAMSENGFGKMTDVSKFRLQKRGGRGIIGMKLTQKTGNLAKIFIPRSKEDLIIISEKGQTIRTKIKTIPILGRSSQGVKVIKMGKGDKTASAITI